MSTRSKFLGVYNIAADKVVDGSFRVAIRKKNYALSTPEKPHYDWFNVNQQFQTEEAAARIYNAYAISFFGKGAVLNDVDATPEGTQEVLAYFNAKENRTETLGRIKEKQKTILESGHTFKLHTQMAHMQDAQTALPV